MDKDPKGGVLGILSCFGWGKKRSTPEEEIIELVDDNDELLPDEKRMIRDILDMGDMAVREIMTPRVDMMLVEDTETVRQAIDRMRGTGFSRLPLYHEDCDTIVGIVHYKDLIEPLLEGRESDPVSDYAYDALFVPETKDVFPLLEEMQGSHQQMAIVVDEYGGTDGLVTVEDIVEEIVGEIGDESDREDALLRPSGENEWLVSGRFPVEDAIELGWPVEESDDYETIAGWLISRLDYVPKAGCKLSVGGFCFRVLRMRRRRIITMKVTKCADAEALCENEGEGE